MQLESTSINLLKLSKLISFGSQKTKEQSKAGQGQYSNVKFDYDNPHDTSGTSNPEPEAESDNEDSEEVDEVLAGAAASIQLLPEVPTDQVRQ